MLQRSRSLSQWGERPRALFTIFRKAEARRSGIIPAQSRMGGRGGVAVDKLAEFPCDVLDGQVQEDIKSDINDGTYDCVGVATPCETFSPLQTLQDPDL